MNHEALLAPLGGVRDPHLRFCAAVVVVAAREEDLLMAGPPAELLDPFRSYNFLVKWDGRYVAAVTSVSGLTRRSAVVSFHAGGQPQSALRPN